MQGPVFRESKGLNPQRLHDHIARRLQTAVPDKGSQPYPKALGMKILDAVSRLDLHLYQQANPKSASFTGPIYNLMTFRYALCAFLLALRKIADGGNVSNDLDKLVNDGYDMSYCAYATYFDGLFTKDKQTKTIYEEARVILRGIKRAAANL